jgi:hypothetical protein
MGGADDSLLGVGQQHRHAIGGEDAKRKARTVGDHGVGDRGVLGFPRLGDGDHPGGVLLIQGDQGARRLFHHFHRQGAVLRYVLRGVAGAVAAVQRGVDAVGNPAIAGEKGVTHATDVIQRGDRDHRRNPNFIAWETGRHSTEKIPLSP